MSMDTYLAIRGQIRTLLTQSCSGDHIAKVLKKPLTQEQVIDQLVEEVWNQALSLLQSPDLSKELNTYSMNIESIQESVRTEITDKVEERVQFEWKHQEALKNSKSRK
jgi:hypothetical protein